MLKARGFFITDSSIGFAPRAAWRSSQLIQAQSSVSWVRPWPIHRGLEEANDHSAAGTEWGRVRGEEWRLWNGWPTDHRTNHEIAIAGYGT